jgi:hypothetical protein
VDTALLAEWQQMFDPGARHPRLHQSRGTLGQNYFFVRRDMIAMRVRNKREMLWLPRIEPQILRGKINSAVVAHLDHSEECRVGSRPVLYVA